MSQQVKEEALDRRGFLKAAVVTAAAATATGAGAALLRSQPPVTSPVSAASVPLVVDVPISNQEAVTELFAQLAAAQADNIRLQAKLDAAQRRLQSAQSHNGEVEAMRLELDTATQQVSVLSGLLALYKQLDEVDLGQALSEGIAAVSGSIAELVDELPTLTEGIEAGRQALAEMEEQFPLLEDGRLWLETHTSTLHTYFQAIEQLLAAAVDAAAPLLVMLNQWFQDVLNWLPFGLGQRASEIMQAMATLVTTTPQTISGLQQHIARPLDTWLGDNQADAPWRQKLVNPLRENVLQPTSRAINQVQQIQVVYQAELTRPAGGLVQQQQRLRQLIDEYRQRYDLA